MKNKLVMKATQTEEGKVAVPLLLWFLGVPGFVVILLWLFIFRG